jgi:hypothetical protein
MPGRSSAVLRKLVEPIEWVIVVPSPLDLYLGSVSSSVGRYIGYRDNGFAWSPLVPPQNVEIELRLGYDRSIQNRFPFIIHP